MNDNLMIKGHVFGQGTPAICTPVVEVSEEAIWKQAAGAAEAGADMVEWRIDWFEGWMEPDRILRVLQGLKHQMSRTILLATFRNKNQGGERQLAPDAYRNLLKRLAESRTMDLLDLEYYETPDAGALTGQLKEIGVRVICSHHEFQKTPPVEEMCRMLQEMNESGADFIKLAVMPRGKQDALNLMHAVLAVREAAPKSHVVAMSMGMDGMITRLLGEWFGSELAFASLNKASAPGQISFEAAKAALDRLHDCRRG